MYIKKFFLGSCSLLLLSGCAYTKRHDGPVGVVSLMGPAYFVSNIPAAKASIKLGRDDERQIRLNYFRHQIGGFAFNQQLTRSIANAVKQKSASTVKMLTVQGDVTNFDQWEKQQVQKYGLSKIVVIVPARHLVPGYPKSILTSYAKSQYETIGYGSFFVEEKHQMHYQLEPIVAFNYAYYKIKVYDPQKPEAMSQLVEYMSINAPRSRWQSTYQAISNQNKQSLKKWLERQVIPKISQQVVGLI